MRSAPYPENEAERQASLKSLNILETAMEERFERVTRLASRLLNVPISAITLIDGERQWFKPIQINANDKLDVTISMGLACFDPADSATCEEVIKPADAGLYRAKEHGRDRIVSPIENSA